MASAHPRSRLSAALDGELSEGQTAAVHAHLSRCLPCRCAMTQIRKGWSAAGVLTGVPAPASLWPAILADPLFKRGTERDA